MPAIFSKLVNRFGKKSLLEEELEKAYARNQERNNQYGNIFDIDQQRQLADYYRSPSQSVYGKPPLFNILADGSYKDLLPENFFPDIVKTSDGRIFLPTSSWTRRNGTVSGDGDTQFEWYFTSLKNGTILKEFTNDYLELRSNYLLMKLVNPKPMQPTCSIEGIYDLSSSEYVEYKPNITDTNNSIKSILNSPEENIFWNDMTSKMTTTEDKIVPASIKATKQFSILFNMIRENKINIIPQTEINPPPPGLDSIR